MIITDYSKQFPAEADLLVKPRSYVNHSVEFKKPYTVAERCAQLDAVGLNVFYFPAEMITGCDMLSDSGTTTMTNGRPYYRVMNRTVQIVVIFNCCSKLKKRSAQGMVEK